MDALGLDRFGGWREKRFEATGFFRTEKDKRWWLVTPEGNAFLSFGINHLHPEFWRQDYNRGAWLEHLQLDSLEGPGFAPALRKWFLRACGQYGFNTVGVHSDLSVANAPAPAMPYMLPISFVDIPHWQDEVPNSHFADVFSAEFAAHCDRLAQKHAAPAKDDPFLLGYAMTDCPLFTEEDCRERPDVIGGAPRAARVGWPRRLRNLPGDAAGKQAYVQKMHALYRGSVDDFNAAYGTRFDSFDALERAADWRPRSDLSNGNETRDNIEFLKEAVARYYRTARDAIRRYDPHHLFVGDKLNGNTDTLDALLPVTSRFTDIAFYQMYARYEVQQSGLDRWSRVVARIKDQPIINGDSAYTMTADTMPRPYGPVADGLEQRAAWTEDFFRQAFARPDFVGWHYCGLIDAPNLIPGKQDRQHSGLLDGYGTPYPLLRERLKTCADALYAIAQGRD